MIVLPAHEDEIGQPLQPDGPEVEDAERAEAVVVAEAGDESAEGGDRVLKEGEHGRYPNLLSRRTAVRRACPR